MSAPISFASAYRQLTPTEKVFVDGYVADVERQAVRACERISLALHRAIPDDVVAASRGMLDRPMVRAAIAERINDIAAEMELTPHRVIKEWMGIAFSSLADYMDIGEDGTPWFDLTHATPEQMKAIKAVKFEETGDGLSRPRKRKIEIVLHDKIAGLEALAKHMGLMERDNETWRADRARQIAPVMLPATVTDNGAADMYAQMING